MNILREQDLDLDYYTYGDYKTWDDGIRWELIDGKAYCMYPPAMKSGILCMGPAPRVAHQTVLGNLFAELKIYFKDKKCRVFMSPFDVSLPKGDESEDEIDTVVQPDILILCDESKLRPSGIVGAPDVVFEILSPSTSARDMNEKLSLYERSGVKEYFIVDADEHLVTAYRRGGDGLYFSNSANYRDADTLEFRTFKELKIPLGAIWE
ncbi:hypothetical protein FACS1894187_03050 [Synergistales bacterium]|nr:hypothetical protein FACS1894187_03050 [Synergistales bacterium]